MDKGMVSWRPGGGGRRHGRAQPAVGHRQEGDNIGFAALAPRWQWAA